MNAIYNSTPIQKLFTKRFETLKSKVKNFSDSQSSSGNLLEIAKRFSSECSLTPLTIDFANRRSYVQMVSRLGSTFPPTQDVNRNQTYSVACVFYEFPILAGTHELIYAIPQSASMREKVSADLVNNSFRVGYRTNYFNEILNDNVKVEVKAAMTPIITSIENMTAVVNNEVSEFNNSLYNIAVTLLNERQTELNLRENQNEELNRL